MPKLTDQIKGSNTRIKALENSNLSNQLAVARIIKQYGNVKITITQRINQHTYNICGAPGVVCGRSIL